MNLTLLTLLASALALNGQPAVPAAANGKVASSPSPAVVQLDHSTVVAAATSSKAAPSVSPKQQDAINYGLEMAAIQMANYRNPGVSHEEAVGLVRQGLSLYAAQAPVQNLLAEASEFYNRHQDTIKSGKWWPTAEDGLNAAKLFEQANKDVTKQANFDELNKFLTENLVKFDLGAGMNDLKLMVEVNPDNARNAISKMHQKVSDSTVHQQTYATVVGMMKNFAAKYNVDGDKFRAHFDLISNAIYNN